MGSAEMKGASESGAVAELNAPPPVQGGFVKRSVTRVALGSPVGGWASPMPAMLHPWPHSSGPAGRHSFVRRPCVCSARPAERPQGRTSRP